MWTESLFTKQARILRQSAILYTFSAVAPWNDVCRISIQLQTQLWHEMNTTIYHQCLEMAARWPSISLWRENSDRSVENGPPV
jgi:hypothetical protein